MKPETLEALMIDRALNELSPEVGELLDAYLAQNPAAAVGLAQIEGAVKLARQAVPVPEAAAQVGQASSLSSRRTGILPVPHSWRNRLEACSTWKVFTIPRRELVRVAAGLALGLLLGWSLPSLWRATEVVQAPSPARHVVADARASRVADSSSQFWSLAAVAAERQARADVGRPSGQRRLQWDSLFKTP